MANRFVFTAGQIPAITGLDNQPETFKEQVRQTLRSLTAVLEAAGSGPAHMVKVNTYLTDPGQLEEYNRVYAEFFGNAKPARRSSLAWRPSATPPSGISSKSDSLTRPSSRCWTV